MTILYNNELDAAVLANRRIAVLGFGSQGRAQALNLKDGGYDVRVGLRAGSAHRQSAEASGIPVQSIAGAVADADVIVMLMPDTALAEVYARDVEPHARANACLVFAHGFALHYGKLKPRPDLDVALVAPMGIGEQVREIFTRGAGVPGLLAVAQDASGEARPLAMAYARAMGHGHAGVIETTVAEETETDLFAEQAVLCGGLNHGITAAFETLVANGYQPEVAYFCCLHEVAYLATMLQRKGIAELRKSISPVAEFGDYFAGSRLIDDRYRNTLQQLLSEIRDGSFVRKLDDVLAQGGTMLAAERQRSAEHQLEHTGATLRAGMPWLNPGDTQGD